MAGDLAALLAADAGDLAVDVSIGLQQDLILSAGEGGIMLFFQLLHGALILRGGLGEEQSGKAVQFFG